MGMTAYYCSIDDAKLKQAMDTNSLESVQTDELCKTCDIDKMWDALHFVLTGKSASDEQNNSLLGEAVVGQFWIEEEGCEEWVGGISAQRVKEIAKVLQTVDIYQQLNRYKLSDFAENEIYPDIWEYEDEEDEIKEDLQDCFEKLKRFYMQVAEEENAVFVTIG